MGKMSMNDVVKLFEPRRGLERLSFPLERLFMPNALKRHIDGEINSLDMPKSPDVREGNKPRTNACSKRSSTVAAMGGSKLRERKNSVKRMESLIGEILEKVGHNNLAKRSEQSQRLSETPKHRQAGVTQSTIPSSTQCHASTDSSGATQSQSTAVDNFV